MATKKKAAVKKDNTRSVYVYTGYDSVLDSMLEDEMSNGFYDKMDEAKKDATDALTNDGDEEIYIYKVTFTKVLVGKKPNVSWEKA